MARTVNDKAEWLTKQEAAQLIGVSERSVERLVAEGKIKQRYLRVAHRRPIAVLDPKGVAQAKEETLARVPPPAVESGNGTHALTVRHKGADALTTLLAALGGKPEQQLPRRFLTLAEAADYIGLTKAYLRRLIDEQKLEAVRDRGLKVRRDDLDKL